MQAALYTIEDHFRYFEDKFIDNKTSIYVQQFMQDGEFTITLLDDYNDEIIERVFLERAK